MERQYLKDAFYLWKLFGFMIYQKKTRETEGSRQ